MSAEKPTPPQTPQGQRVRGRRRAGGMLHARATSPASVGAAQPAVVMDRVSMVYNVTSTGGGDEVPVAAPVRWAVSYTHLTLPTILLV